MACCECDLFSVESCVCFSGHKTVPLTLTRGPVAPPTGEARYSNLAVKVKKMED